MKTPITAKAPQLECNPSEHNFTVLDMTRTVREACMTANAAVACDGK